MAYWLVAWPLNHLIKSVFMSLKLKSTVLGAAFIAFSFLNLKAQSDKSKIHFLHFDSTYVYVDNNKDNWFTFEFNADTLELTEDNMVIYNNMKLLQINVIPFSKIIPKQKRSIPMTKALQAYKKWELDYHQKLVGTKLKNGEEFYFDDGKPFLIWWQKYPPDKTKNKESVNKTAEYDIETGSLVETETLHVTHMLCLNFSIYGKQNVAVTIPVFENENLKDEIKKLKRIANSLRVYGGPVDLEVLTEIKTTNKNYILKDDLGLLKLNVPEWMNILKPFREQTFFATFPEKDNVVNAMAMRWEYESDSLSFYDLINQSSTKHKETTNYRLIEENETVFKYFYTSEGGWFLHQNVYIKSNGILYYLNFTATKNTYDYNVGRFEEILSRLVLN